MRWSFDVGTHDTFLSFLPLSHTLERTCGYYLTVMAGARVAFARSIPQLSEDLAIIRPTVLISVPRTVDNGMLTPTLELRRAKVLEQHRADYDKLYAEH